MYRPLPPQITIKKSNIDGLGLFSTCDIEEGYNLGISHIANNRFENKYIRSPLGGFMNHSNTPNCRLIKITPSLELSDNSTDTVLILITKQLIVANTELTKYYSLYKILEEETL